MVFLGPQAWGAVAVDTPGRGAGFNRGTFGLLGGGVGGLAAGVLSYPWEKTGSARPIFVVVEPETAACLFESAKAGAVTAVGGDLDTIMAGLACGVAGMVSLGRFGTASTSSGSGYELTVIAAAVVGGASLSGGRGTAIGALLGTLVIALIENGIYILHLQQEYRLIIIGVAIIVAVALDRVSEYLRQRRLAQSGASRGH